MGVNVPLQLQTAVAIDKDGNQVLAGSFAGHLAVDGTELVSAGSRDIFVAKSDKKGAAVFPAQRFGGKGDDAATGVAVDAAGNIVVVGTFEGQAAFGFQSLEAKVQGREQRGVFAARLNAKGEVQWVRQVGVVSVPTQVSVAIGADKSIVVGASISAAAKAPDGTAIIGGESLILTFLNESGEPIPRQPPMMLLSRPAPCEHSLCEGNWDSPPLVAGCGMYGCTAMICAPYVDSYCCTNHWDPICVAEVTSVCHRRCDCSTICTEGEPFYPDACPIARNVISADPACGYSWGTRCVDAARTMGACP